MEYTIYPPTLHLSIAALKSSFYKWEALSTSFKDLFTLIEGSLDIIPRPVQGASKRTQSKFFKL